MPDNMLTITPNANFVAFVSISNILPFEMHRSYSGDVKVSQKDAYNSFLHPKL